MKIAREVERKSFIPIDMDEDSVTEFIEESLVANPRLMYLEEDYPKVRVILHVDYQPADLSRVALTATGDNHDIMRGGVLTAAVYGDRFGAPPSEDTIMAALREVTTRCGTLMIVKKSELKNYKKASRTAREEGLLVDILSFTKIPDEAVVAAGTAAAKCLSLAEVKDVASRAKSVAEKAGLAHWKKKKTCCFCEVPDKFIRIGEYHKHVAQKH